MPKNVGIEVHLKDSKVSQTSSNYIVLKMSEKVAAGRSWEITLSSSVKWSHCLVSFFRAALWNTASSNLKVTWRIRQRVFRRKVWPCPFASMCKSMDKKRWKMTLHVSQRTSACSSSLLKGEEGPWGSCAGSLHSSGAWCHALRFNSGIRWQPEQPGCQRCPNSSTVSVCGYQNHDAACIIDTIVYGVRYSGHTRTALVLPFPKCILSNIFIWPQHFFCLPSVWPFPACNKRAADRSSPLYTKWDDHLKNSLIIPISCNLNVKH